ncbi:type II secretion system F family protein [Vibrio tapetis]|uniref:Type II secretion system protein GspF domain-containing protein n=1 Tax=Vibrio tapetis subsp. tapetis TaxID=1671868 RepID=A0A2N8ZDH5_9VIBR|nr:type II secretion system F family protein [Vibrio tapetis]SON49954.1 conserved membrane protein of unknown function [Vibrio tapetis subsp. tapetis]
MMNNAVYVLAFVVCIAVIVAKLERKQKRLATLRSQAKRVLSIHYQGDFAFAKLSASSMSGFELQLQSVKSRITLPVMVVGIGAGALCYKMSASIVLTFGVAVVVMALTSKLIIAHQAKKALQQLEAQLPDAIEVFARAIAAGVPLNRSVLSVSESFEGALGSEFRKIYDALLLGVSFQQAFSDAADRVDSEAFGYFTAVLSLNTETGGPLVDALSNLGASLREKSKIHQKVLALTAEPRVAARVVTAIPIVLLSMQFVKQPEQIDFLLNDPSGQSVLAYAVVSMALGLIWINRLTKVS